MPPVQRLPQTPMPMLLPLLFGLLATAQGCLPGERSNDPLPDVKVDSTAADAGKSDAKADAAKTDASPDAAADEIGGSSDATDEVTILAEKGCTADGDCKTLPQLPCHLAATCNTATGLCESALAAEATSCVVDACWTGQTCDASGTCGGGKVKDCSDGNPCTLDLCANGVCTHPNVSSGSCTDGVQCTVTDHCVAGKCVGTPLNCEDGNPCTDDSCNENGDPSGGIFNICNHSSFAYTTKSVPCPATDPLLSPFCDNGNCGLAKDCDDKNICTTDSQDPLTGNCVNTYVGDGIACGTDKCITGKCQMSTDAVPLPTCVTSVKCDDGLFCTKDVCDPSTGNCDNKTTLSAGTPCTSTDPCVVNGQCDGKKMCKTTKPVACNDGNPCTDDSCVSGAGCTSTPVTKATSCNDGNGCTTGDTCANGLCGGTPIVVDDGNACTNDACDPTTGISHTLVVDGTACGTNSTCSKGICVAK